MIHQYLMLALLGVGSLTLCFAQEQIIPKPVSIDISQGAAVSLSPQSRLFVSSADKELMKQAQFIRQELQKGTGLSLPLIDSASSQLKPQAQDIVITIDQSLLDKGEEAYKLSGNAQGLTLSAGHPRGLYYAFVSLSQMLPTAFHDAQADKKTIAWTVAKSPFTISDYPRFGWRSFMLDEARYFFGMEEVKRIIDQLALLKMNIFHWSLTNDEGWRIEIKKYPRLTEVGAQRRESEITWWGSGKYDGKPHSGYYTQDQIKEVVAYAAARNITVVPEINSPSHIGAGAAAYPELSLKAPEEVPTRFATKIAFNPVNEFSYKFLSDVYDEILPLFPSGVIHTGGDEVQYHRQWKDEKVIEDFMKEQGMTDYTDVQMYFSNRIARILKEKGRRMMGWNEIMGVDVNGEGGGKSSMKLDPSAIVHFWKGNHNLARQAIRDGHDVVNSDHEQTYLDYSYGSISLEKAYNFDPIFKGLTEKEGERVIGFGCQMWTEWTPTKERMNYQAFPRTVAFADAGWSPKEGKDFDDFEKRLKSYCKRMDTMGIAYAPNIKVTELKKSDFNEVPLIAQWTPADLERNIIEIDVSSRMTTQGKYVVTFLYDKGLEGMKIKSAALYIDGKQVAIDEHQGFSGLLQSNIQYKIYLDEFKKGAAAKLRVELDHGSALDSHGFIYFDAP